MKVLFLDFDGVLNSCNWFRSRYLEDVNAQELEGKLDPEAVANLNRIIEETGCQVVISSTWRRSNSLGTLLRLLCLRGFDKKHWDNFIGVTPVLDRKDREMVERGHEIQAWLDKHPEKFDRIVILDDDGDMVHLMPHLVLTSGETGLDTEKTEDVIRRLNEKA